MHEQDMLLFVFFVPFVDSLFAYGSDNINDGVANPIKLITYHFSTRLGMHTP